MENKRQIICFIAPSKFAKLLGNKLPEDIGFQKDDTYLNNDKKLAYVSESGQIEINEFNKKLAESASIILVPDTFDFNYNPLVSFKIVSHTDTPNAKVDSLKQNPNCSGFIKSIEEDYEGGAKTIYKQIADSIKHYYEKS